MLNAPFSFYIKELGGTEMLVGIAAGGFALTSLLMRPLAGWILDNKSRSIPMIWGLMAVTLITLLYIIFPILGIAIFLRIITGFLFSGVHTSSSTNASDAVPKSRFGEGMGFLGLGNTLASATGPILGLAITASLGFQPLFAISISVLLAAILIARSIQYKTVGQPGKSYNKKFRLLSLFCPEALPASLVMLFICIPHGGISVFIALYGEFSGLGSGGLYFILLAVGTGSTRLFSGRLADKKGEKPMVFISAASALLAMILLTAESSICYYSAGLFFGIAFGISFPAMLAMSMRLVPLEKRGSASSTFFCSNDIGMGLGSIISGWLVTVLGYRPMFGIMTVFVFVYLLTYILWASKSPSAFKNYLLNQSKSANGHSAEV